MNSETSEGKEKRVRNLETKTVVSSLGPNLFMYAESFWRETVRCNYCAGKELFIIVVLLALVNFILDDQSYLLQHLVEHWSLSGSIDLLHSTVYYTLFPFSPYLPGVVTLHRLGSMFRFSFKL